MGTYLSLSPFSFLLFSAISPTLFIPQLPNKYTPPTVPAIQEKVRFLFVMNSGREKEGRERGIGGMITALYPGKW